LSCSSHFILVGGIPLYGVDFPFEEQFRACTLRNDVLGVGVSVKELEFVVFLSIQLDSHLARVLVEVE
jgi:hypothetical protein